MTSRREFFLLAGGGLLGACGPRRASVVVASQEACAQEQSEFLVACLSDAEDDVRLGAAMAMARLSRASSVVGSVVASHADVEALGKCAAARFQYTLVADALVDQAQHWFAREPTLIVQPLADMWQTAPRPLGAYGLGWGVSEAGVAAGFVSAQGWMRPAALIREGNRRELKLALRFNRLTMRLGGVSRIRAYSTYRQLASELRLLHRLHHDSIFLPGCAEDGSTAIELTSSMSWDVPFLGTHLWAALTNPTGRELFRTDVFCADEGVLKEFSDAFAEVHGKPPNSAVALGFDSVLVLARATEDGFSRLHPLAGNYPVSEYATGPFLISNTRYAQRRSLPVLKVGKGGSTFFSRTESPL